MHSIFELTENSRQGEAGHGFGHGKATMSFAAARQHVAFAYESRSTTFIQTWLLAIKDILRRQEQHVAVGYKARFGRGLSTLLVLRSKVALNSTRRRHGLTVKS